MKKIFIYTALLSTLAFIFSTTVSADLIAPGSHSLYRCVKFVNLNDFPNVVLIGDISGPGGENTYELNNNCLTKGYKFNSLNVYWMTKEKFNSIDLNNFNPSDANLLLTNLEVYGGYVADSNPLINDNIEYSIAGFSSGNLIVYKSKETQEYNNGNPAKVETFNSPLLITPPVKIIVPPVISSGISVCKFIDMLISIGVVDINKASLARSKMGCTSGW